MNHCNLKAQLIKTPTRHYPPLPTTTPNVISLILKNMKIVTRRFYFPQFPTVILQFISFCFALSDFQGKTRHRLQLSQFLTPDNLKIIEQRQELIGVLIQSSHLDPAREHPPTYVICFGPTSVPLEHAAETTLRLYCKSMSGCRHHGWESYMRHRRHLLRLRQHRALKVMETSDIFPGNIQYPADHIPRRYFLH